MPKTPLGKLQRIGLAERLGLTATAPRPASRSANDYVAPRSALEKEIVEAWAEILRRKPETIGTTMEFRDLGGDSLAATRLVFRVREKLQVMVTILDFFDAPTVAQQAQVIEELRRTGPSQQTPATLIPVQAGGTRTPLFCLHALDGGVYLYQSLLPYLNPEQPIYGLQAVGMDGTVPPLQSLEEIVDYNIAQIRSVQLHGPYFLMGYSFGGNVALEIARKLHDEEKEPVYTFIIDSHFQVNYTDSVLYLAPANAAVKLRRRASSLLFAIFSLPMPYKLHYFRQKLAVPWNKLVSILRPRAAKSERDARVTDNHESLPPPIQQVQLTNNRIGTHWVPRPYYGPITFLRGTSGVVSIPFFRVWKQIAKGPAEIINLPVDHNRALREPQVQIVAAQLQQWLDKFNVQTNNQHN